MPKPETDKPRSQPIVNLKLFSTEPPLRPLALQPLALAPLPVCFSSLGQPSHSGGWWPPESLRRRSQFSQPHEARQGGWRGGPRELQTGNQNWGLGLCHPQVSWTWTCLPRAVWAKWGLFCPWTENGDNSFQGKVKEITYNKGCVQVSSGLGKRLGPDVHPTSS